MTYRHLWLQLLIGFGGAALVSMALAACLTTEASIGASALKPTHRNGDRGGDGMADLRPADLRVYIKATPTRIPAWDAAAEAHTVATAQRDTFAH